MSRDGRLRMFPQFNFASGIARPWMSFAGLLLLLVIHAPALGQTQAAAERLYLEIFRGINEADALYEKGETNAARTKYIEAEAALSKFKQTHRTWNPSTVAFRLKYLDERIALLSKPADSSVASESSAIAAGSTYSRASGTFSDVPELRLIEPGAEPRRALRYQTDPGGNQRVELSVQNNSRGNSAIGGGAVPVRGPLLRMVLEVQPRDADGDGFLPYQLLFEEVTLSDQSSEAPVPEELKLGLDSLKGMRIDGAINDRGFSRTSSTVMPDGSSPQASEIAESLRDFACLFPEEAVGPGARWEVRQRIKMQGAEVNQTRTYELLSVEGDLVALRISTTRSAGAQKVSHPSAPELQVDLTRISGTGTITLTVDLRKRLASQASSSDSTTVAMAINIGGRRDTITVRTDQTVRLQDK
jgi:hypothetical protein